MQASVPLGVDDITRIEIENSICREGGPLPECFTFPMEHVLCLLEEVTHFILCHLKGLPLMTPTERFLMTWTITCWDVGSGHLLEVICNSVPSHRVEGVAYCRLPNRFHD